MKPGPSAPPELDDIPSAEGSLPGPELLAGRPYALPVDLLGELYGPLFYADFDGERKLYACSANLVEELCDEQRFAKNLTQSLARVRPLAGDGLFTSFYGEPNWQKAHDVLLPGFSYAGLRNYHSAMLDINCQLISRWDARAGSRPVDVSTDLQKLAMDTVALAGFGARFNSFDVDGLAPIPASFTAALGEVFAHGPTPEFESELATLHAYFDDLVTAHESGSADAGAAAAADLLYVMLGHDANGAPLLDRENVNNQIMTFLIAGQLTTSELMPNMLYNIVHHPAVLARVRAEADDVFGVDDDYLPTYDDIGKFNYLRQVVNETLRLSPPVLEFDRMALSDTVIGGKYPIKKGEAVAVLTGALHRQPEWGDNVEFFDPDRFSPEISRPASLFKPFGTGARSCIGRQFALHEATLAIARLIHRYRLIDSQHYVLTWDGPSSRRPAGFHLDLIRRTAEDRQTHAEPDPPDAESASGQVAAVKAGTTLAVLYGSNLGTCRALAKQFAEEATGIGCQASVASLDSAAGGLPQADATLIIASSYNGQPTDDARAFLAWLEGPDATLSGAPIFAVLGVGDHNWADTYQAIPERIDARMAELGGTRLVPRGAADTSGDLNGAIEEFAGTAGAALAQRFGDPDAAPLSDADEPLYELHPITGPVTTAIDARFAVAPMTVLENTELVSDKAFGQAKNYVRVALPDGTDYHTGDHLTVLADNPPELVNTVIELLEIDPELRLSINPRRYSRRLIALDREVSVRELLTHFVELRKPASPSQLKRLAAVNPCVPERRRLEELATAGEPNVLSTLECLLEFPACEVTEAELLELLEPMTPRHYSIASSSRLSPQVVGLVVSVLGAPARSGYGQFQGVASNHLAGIGPGDLIRARVDPARQAFRAGADPTRNVILVSAGTGVAPFCGFLGDRLAAQQSGEPFAPALCFFGVRDPDVDYIFRDQFEEGEALGIMRMRPAFSRASEDGVRYVQDRIAADADEVWDLLGDTAKDTYVYVCGDGGRMAPAVRQAFLGIYRSRTGTDERQAQDWLDGLVQSDRYVEDVWAG